MKKLIISLKSPKQSLNEFSKALALAKKGKLEPHYEIAFDNKKDFNHFIQNISVLVNIKKFKPSSIYQLAKIMNMNQSNLNKVILFFEKIGATKIETKVKGGKFSKIPRVDYKSIEFNLASM